MCHVGVVIDQQKKGAIHMDITTIGIDLVRRHSNWNNQRPDLKEDLAHLVQYIKRRICGIASAGSPLSSV